MKRIIAAFIILSCLQATNLYSQTKTDISLAYELATAPENEDYSFRFGSTELENLKNFLFVFYKKFISSQDMQVCTFHPSCSVYATEALSHHGLVIGAMATFDRMSRCHPLAGRHYPVHHDSGLLHDPVIADK